MMTGLRLVQEELSGTVSVYGICCFVDRARFRPVKAHPFSRLGRSDQEALESYPERCPVNWDQWFKSVEEGREAVFGCYDGGRLAGYSTATLCEKVGDGGVSGRPEFSGRGYGRSLLSAAAEEVLQKNDTVLYHSCMEDMATLRVCLAVGFAPLREVLYFEGRRRP